MMSLLARMPVEDLDAMRKILVLRHAAFNRDDLPRPGARVD